MSRAKLRTRDGWRAIDRLGLFGTAAIAIALVLIWPRTTIPNPLQALFNRDAPAELAASAESAVDATTEAATEGVGQLADAGRTVAGSIGQTITAQTQGDTDTSASTTEPTSPAEPSTQAADANTQAGDEASGDASGQAASEEQAGTAQAESSNGGSTLAQTGESLLARARQALSGSDSGEDTGSAPGQSATTSDSGVESAQAGADDPSRVDTGVASTTESTSESADRSSSESAGGPAGASTGEPAQGTASESAGKGADESVGRSASEMAGKPASEETLAAQDEDASSTGSAREQVAMLSPDSTRAPGAMESGARTGDATATGGATANATLPTTTGAATASSPEAAEPTPTVTLDCDDLNAGIDLRFGSGASGLAAREQAMLRAIARCAQRNQLTLEVSGHTDSEGDIIANLLLSSQRAERVAAQLDRLGVPGEKLLPRGYGESQPRADNFTAAGRAKNRRVTIRRVAG